MGAEHGTIDHRCYGNGGRNLLRCGLGHNGEPDGAASAEWQQLVVHVVGAAWNRAGEADSRGSERSLQRGFSTSNRGYTDPASIEALNGVFSDWLGGSAPHVAADLGTGFAGLLKWNKVWNGVRQGVHTLPRAQCNSLVSVRTPKTNLSFSEVFGKLKATVNDGAASYQLTVSSKVLKEAWRAGGLAAVNNALPARAELHVRVGLARPFDEPPKCYAMLNGAL